MVAQAVVADTIEKKTTDRDRSRVYASPGGFVAAMAHTCRLYLIDISIHL